MSGNYVSDLQIQGVHFKTSHTYCTSCIQLFKINYVNRRETIHWENLRKGAGTRHHVPSSPKQQNLKCQSFDTSIIEVTYTFSILVKQN